MKQRLGRTGIAFVGMGEILRYDFPPLVLTGVNARDEPVELRGAQVILATVKRWAGGNTGIPMADPGDDLIDAVVVEPRSRLHMLIFWGLMTMPGGRPLTLPGVRHVQLKRARVECADGHAIEAHVNGEPVAKTPFVMEPGGVVKVIVPEGRA
jgi:diacylglycerol kinase family enzyme